MDINEINKESMATMDPHTVESTSCLPESDGNGRHASDKTPPPIPHWYALRCTYGREKMSYEYLSAKGVKAFYPTTKTRKVVAGKKKNVEVSRLPNIFFAFGTQDELKEYVFDNSRNETKYLRFYYNQHHDGTREPLVVPEAQIRSLMLICGSGSDDVVMTGDTVGKYVKGRRVMVTEGDFAGVEGVVARWCGQQRVGVVIEGLLTVTTAYVPTAFLKPMEE